MHDQPATRFELLLLAGTAAGCLLGGVAAWRSATYAALAFCALLGLLALWSLTDSLRHGVRDATPFERFEQHLIIYALVVFVGGGLALFFGWEWLRAAPVPWAPGVTASLRLLALGIWLLASLRGVTRLRGKHETPVAYLCRLHATEVRQPLRAREQ